MTDTKRSMQRTELDASIAKQAFVTVTSEIPKLHFVKLTKKHLGGWKSKDKYEMRTLLQGAAERVYRASCLVSTILSSTQIHCNVHCDSREAH